MKTFFLFILFTLLAIVAIVLGVIIGDYGAWYFSWVIGTVMIVLVSAAGGAFMDAQQEQEQSRSR